MKTESGSRQLGVTLVCLQYVCLYTNRTEYIWAHDRCSAFFFPFLSRSDSGRLVVDTKVGKTVVHCYEIRKLTHHISMTENNGWFNKV